MDLRFLDPNGQPTREAFNERFNFLNTIMPRIDSVSNEYVWNKQTRAWTWTTVHYTDNAVVAVTSQNISYSDSIHVEDGEFILDNPKRGLASKVYTEFVGKYILPDGYDIVDEGGLIFIEQDATLSISGTSILCTGGWGKVSNPVSVLSTVGYVNSPNPNSYPPADDDGFTYNLLGRLGDNTRIETGSYVGTGTYGASNPNSLTLGFKPQVVIVQSLSSRSGFLTLYGNDASLGYSKVLGLASLYSATIYASWLDNTLSWHAKDYTLQLNDAGSTFKYLAIG